jgi:ABC-2 type transport system permease protein
MHALLYLQLATVQGQVRSRLRRLKQPKYLVGAVVGAAYLYFFFIHRMRPNYGSPRYRQPPDLPSDMLPTIAVLGSLALLIVVVLSWVLPRASASLAFTEAEISVLFPAPIRRRTLIHYRLLKTQLALAFTSLLLAIFSNRWSFLGGNAAMHALGWWLILSTLSLHFTGSSFAITQLVNSGMSSWRRRAVVLAIVAAVVVVTFVWVRSAARAPEPADLRSFSAITRYVLALLSSGPLPWLLALPKLVLAPFLAPNGRAFALALAPALLVLGAHYLWVLRMEVSFEEASLARAEKRSARLKAMQQGTSRTGPAVGKVKRSPFRLGATGRPEVAFLWKNLLSAPAYFRPRTALIAAVIIVAGCTWLAGSATYGAILPAVSIAGMGMAAFAVVLGPQFARFDLRADLLNADILKTYPMRGWQIVLGELLTPVAVLTIITWLALLTAALAAPTRAIPWLSPGARVAIPIGLALLAPPFCALQLLVPNALAVLFPAWTQTVSNRSERGLDVMGQRIIFLAGQLLVAGVALLPATVVAVVVFFLSNWLLGQVAAGVIAALLLVGILVVEVGIGLRWLGARFENFDLSSELRV